MDTATLPLPTARTTKPSEKVRTTPQHLRKLPATLPLVQSESPLGAEADLILRYWRDQEPLPLRKPVIPEGAVLSSLCVGLGDSLMLTDLPRAAREQGRHVKVMSTSPHFRPLMRFNPGWVEPDLADQSILINAASLVRHFDCGNGHYLQRLRRAFGFAVEADCVPRPCVAWSGQRHKNRVVLHFDPGVHVLWQRKTIHPDARRLIARTRSELEKFIASSPSLEFITVGAAPDKKPIRGARFVQTRTLADLVQTIAQSAYHIGILSGPLHLAAALGLKIITILDWPEGWKVFAPTLRASRQGESEWTYAQAVHLHQTSAGPLCPLVSERALHQAVAGEIWPRWQTRHCALIHEKL